MKWYPEVGHEGSVVEEIIKQFHFKDLIYFCEMAKTHFTAASGYKIKVNWQAWQNETMIIRQL